VSWLFGLKAVRAEQHMSYLPWYVAAVFLAMIVISRLLTNYYVRLRYQEILLVGLQPGFCPPWVSSLYLFGRLGLFVSGIWSFVIAWWAPIPVVVAYYLQMVVVPSAVLKAIQEAPEKQASAAVQHAARELGSVVGYLQAAKRGEPCDANVEDAIRRAMDAVEQAKPLIEAVPDPKERMGMLMFLQDRLERFQSAIDGMASESGS
jgi:hypothetical protein